MARLIEVERALGYAFVPPPTSFSERDVALYGLATGAADDPYRDVADAAPLRRTTELVPPGIEVSPGFIAVLALNALVASLRAVGNAPGLHYGIDRVMHAEQRIEVLGPLPAHGALGHAARIAALHDKGRHAYVVTEVETRDASGALVMKSAISSLVRQAGGFAPEGGPKSFGAEAPPAPAPLPERAPDLVIEQATRPNQALLFRLLGDDNPLHADPKAARAFGLPRPILHGMCTYGFVLRHLVDAFADGDPSRLRAADVRFSDVVFPGETLVTEAFREPDGVVRFQAKVKERDRVVLSHGVARFGDAAPVLEVPSDAPLREEVDAAIRAIAAHVAARPALARAIGARFQVRLREPDAAFVIDLRPGDAPPAVRIGVEDSDCGVALRARDFFALARGESTGRALYLTGKLEMSGKASLAPHLDFLREVGREAPAAAVTDAGPSAGDAEVLARIAARVPASLGFAGGVTLALGATMQAVGGDARASIRFADEAAARALADGQSSLRSLFMRGRARIDGDMSVARALDRALAPSGERGEE